MRLELESQHHLAKNKGLQIQRNKAERDDKDT